jgi:CheY-like chemotaxis protein
MELDNTPIDLHELFIRCQTMIKPKADAKSLLLHLYAEPIMDKVPTGDAKKLLHVLLNLLTNAVKFTDVGTVHLKALVSEMDEKTVTLYFEVKDSGIGMTPEQAAKIFDPFTQAQTDTTRKYGGTGLGLAITKTFVELMGGTLALETELGVGSKFSFSLTFNLLDMKKEDLPVTKMIFNTMERPVFEGEILLCEDNNMNQQVICEHLERVGFKTVVAENGKLGVEMVEDRLAKGEKQFDLIFMDIHMPVMDGLVASGKINALALGVPIVAMTANIMYDDKEFYKSSGMNDCVSKPFTSQELWQCLMRYFKPMTWQREDAALREKADGDLNQKLINNFVKSNRTKAEEIENALNAGDIKLAHRLAHSLKNNAGQLKKMGLQKITQEMEALLQDGENKVTPQHLEVLNRELSTSLAELGPLVYEPPPEAEEEPLGAEAIRALFEKLEPMLVNYNTGCLVYINDLKRIPGSEALIQHIQNIDFVLALRAFSILKEGVEK